MYDFINLGKKGVNWASNLSSYSRILNEESKEELGWKSIRDLFWSKIKYLCQGIVRKRG